jgi:multidrug efflux pump subunit AcrB
VTGPIAWFARNPVAANLIAITIAAAGLLTAPRIKQEVFPEVDTGLISISVAYPGAAPAEVEESVCVPIEEEIRGLDGVKRVRSTAAENAGFVTAELTDDADPSRVLDDVKSRVEGIDSFPEDAEKPVVEKVSMRMQVINVAVSGPAEERTIKEIAQQVRDEISALPGITHVTLAAVRPYEVSIEVSEVALRRHAITFDDVVRAVRRSSLDLPGGSVRTDAGEILLRAVGRAYRGPEFEELVLLSRPDGSRLRLGDVATVVDGFRETDQGARFDGEPAALVQVFRVGEQGATRVADTVRAWVADAQPRMPAGIRLTPWQDDSELLRARRDTLLKNGAQGFALVLVSLSLFLRFRLALWVAAGVPIALFGALWVMPIFDVSVNLLSLFAFILVLGILVDDATVVGENVHTRRKAGEGALEAAIGGTRQVSVPVVFGVLTTVAAFLPMVNQPGVFGRLSRVIPVVVIAALLFSLLESQLVLPAHLAHSLGDDTARSRIARAWRRFQDGFHARFERFVHGTYARFLDRCIEQRWVALAAAVGVLVVALGWVAGGRLPFVFFPQVEGDNVVALLTLPQGTPAEVTAAALGRIEAAAERLRGELADDEGGRDAVQHVLATVGEQPFRNRQRGQGGGMGGEGSSTGAHLGEVNLQLAPSELRSVRSAEIADRWRALTGPVPDAIELVFTASLFSTGDPISIELRGPDLAGLRSAADALKAALAAYPGVRDVADSFREGKQELSLRIRPSAEALGLSQADLARQVRQAFYGDEAQRIQRGRDEVRVMVRYPESERRSLGDVEAMRIRLPDGTAVPFSAVAEAELGRGYAAIRRTDRQRTLTVTADVDTRLANANDVLASLRAGALPAILADHSGLQYALEGEQREQGETLANMRRGFLLALIMIYALLAVPLKSYAQPLLIMSAIPFGVVGAVAGHALLGKSLSMLSIIGIVALSGVVVNNALVLVDWVNERRRAGEPLDHAIRGAGVARFRPVLLTSLTTFVGLVPIVLETSVQAQFLIPMAISLAFGVLVSTVVTLVTVPVLYRIGADLRASLARGTEVSGARAPAPRTS